MEAYGGEGARVVCTGRKKVHSHSHAGPMPAAIPV